MQPVEDPNSNCYQCEAGMCDHQICRGDQYHYLKDSYDPYENETNEEREERLRLQFLRQIEYNRKKAILREAAKVVIINRLESTSYH